MTGGMNEITHKLSNETSRFKVANATDNVEVMPLQPMLHRRAWHATAACDPLLFVIGGSGYRDNPTKTCECFDTRSNM